MMKLSLEQREALEAVTDTDGYTTYLNLIGILVTDIDNRVLSYNLSEGPEGLVIAKAQSEGARTLYKRIMELKGKTKKQDQ